MRYCDNCEESLESVAEELSGLCEVCRIKRNKEQKTKAMNPLESTPNSMTQETDKPAEHTPGPWFHSKASVYVKREFDNDLWVAECRTYQDAAFIASAPALSQEVAELRKENERLKSESSTWRKGFEGLQESFIKQSSNVKRLTEALEEIIAIELDQYKWKHDCVAIAKAALNKTP